MGFRLGIVKSVYDEYDSKRIRVRIIGTDDHIKDDKLPYAVPLLPKMFQVLPKVGEMVGVFNFNESNAYSQRLYIGPFISQPQFMNLDMYSANAASMFDGAAVFPNQGVSNNADTYGAFAGDDDVAVYGRLNTELFLKPNEVQLRCGVRHSNPQDTKDVRFNRDNPAYIAMKYYDTPLSTESGETKSIVNVVAQKINLVSTEGTPYFNMVQQDSDNPDGNGLMMDDVMREIIEKSHRLPYGDILIEFLSSLYSVFKAHTHNYHNLPPLIDPTMQAFETKYGTTKQQYSDKMLSKNVTCN